jgi:hypothetical protein
MAGHYSGIGPSGDRFIGSNSPLMNADQANCQKLMPNIADSSVPNPTMNQGRSVFQFGFFGNFGGFGNPNGPMNRSPMADFPPNLRV